MTLDAMQRPEHPRSLENFPSCTESCITAAIIAQFCGLDDSQCLCENIQFKSNITECVEASCTLLEALASKNATMAYCDSPPRNRSQQLVEVSLTMASIALVFVFIRLSHKIFLRPGFGLDDWLILSAMVLLIPSAFINVYGLSAHGLGKDIWTLSAEEITAVLMYFHIMAWLYFLETALVKLSITYFHLRIFPASRTRQVLWGTIMAIAIWGAVFVLIAIFQCRPVSYFWNHWDGMHQGSCLDANTIAWSNAAINIFLDLWILAIPLWKLRRLQLHWKKKVGVAVMFGIGTLVTVVSMLRLDSLIVFAQTTNSTWDFYNICLWSTLEVTVGVVCACLPAARQVLILIFPALSSATQGQTDDEPYGPAIRITSLDATVRPSRSLSRSSGSVS